MKLYRVAIPASLVFDVKAESNTEAKEIARTLATVPLDDAEGMTLETWPAGRLYLWPKSRRRVDIEDIEEMP